MVIMLLNYTLKLMLLSKDSDMQGNSLYRPYDLKDFNAMRIRFFIKPQRPTASPDFATLFQDIFYYIEY
jgi:hypothetical protein